MCALPILLPALVYSLPRVRTMRLSLPSASKKEIPKVGLEQQKVRPADILQYPPLSSFLTLVLKGYMKGG